MIFMTFLLSNVWIRSIIACSTLQKVEGLSHEHMIKRIAHFPLNYVQLLIKMSQYSIYH